MNSKSDINGVLRGGAQNQQDQIVTPDSSEHLELVQNPVGFRSIVRQGNSKILIVIPPGGPQCYKRTFILIAIGVCLHFAIEFLPIAELTGKEDVFLGPLRFIVWAYTGIVISTLWSWVTVEVSNGRFRITRRRGGCQRVKTNIVETGNGWKQLLNEPVLVNRSGCQFPVHQQWISLAGEANRDKFGNLLHPNELQYLLERIKDVLVQRTSMV
ncbi:hypothetical protein BSKO_13699 [Bryopsis sp. KO-2023]|nr:hypothetical protein BSKO_13699 [Bryopsis sp. KO-2023]